MDIRKLLSRAVFCCGLLLVLAGCAAHSGAPYPDVKSSLETPAANKARLIVFRDESWVGVTRRPTIKLNGAEACALPRAGFFSIDLEPGDVTISSNLWDKPGVSSTRISLQPATVTFVRVRFEPNRTAGSILAGPVGYFIGAQMSGTQGPFVFDIVDKTAAAQNLNGIREVQCQRS
ncbi:MAG TPA: hypothetical protein VGL11_07055 [Candidatus Binatia bacterium]|jgi:hypothetical protein